jgi:PAS domain S-box-containing protein
LTDSLQPTEPREREREFQLLADALPVLVSYLEADNGEVRYRFANKIYEEWFPHKREDIQGRLVREVVGEAAYANVRPYVERALAGERLTFEQFMPYQDGPQRHIRVEYVPRLARDGSGKVEGIYTLVQDITAAKAAEAALRESEEDYRWAAELNPQVAWTAMPDGQLDRVAPRWAEWTGGSGLGSSYAEGLHPDDVQPTFDAWGHSVATGEPYDIVHRVKRTNGEFRWIRSRAYPRRDEAGRIIRWYGSTEDIHDQKTAEDHLKLMVLELNHRVKNNLATVQSIAVQTLRGSESPAEAREAFLQRITALAAAHDILTREQWEGVGVAEVARGVLDPLTATRDRIRLAGPEVRLGPKATLSLAMAFHELGTNALKYGALSGPEGWVDIIWSDGGELRLTWSEHGGPPVTQPTRRGFGTRLLERGVASELKGEVKLTYAPEGLICTIWAPLETG